MHIVRRSLLHLCCTVCIIGSSHCSLSWHHLYHYWIICCIHIMTSFRIVIFSFRRKTVMRCCSIQHLDYRREVVILHCSICHILKNSCHTVDALHNSIRSNCFKQPHQFQYAASNSFRYTRIQWITACVYIELLLCEMQCYASWIPTNCYTSHWLTWCVVVVKSICSHVRN